MNNTIDAPTKIDLKCDEIYDKLMSLEPNTHIKINGHIVKMNNDDMYIIDGDNMELYFYQVHSILTKEIS